MTNIFYLPHLQSAVDDNDDDVGDDVDDDIDDDVDDNVKLNRLDFDRFKLFVYTNF